MLLELDDKILSADILQEKFTCDLSKCKGACCVEGSDGAPLSSEEVQTIEKLLPEIKPYMRPEAIEYVDEMGVSYLDWEKEPVTQIINGKECVFVYFDEENIAKCAIEKGFLEGKYQYKKPISCYLYPIRIKKYEKFTALNYHQWDICEDARINGKETDLNVFEFLKDPIIQRFGVEFYQELIEVKAELKKEE
jgi:hypothetical protein